jgi:acyl-CoA thioester hydrolase
MSRATTLVREPESLLIARFQDCDPFGHLNNARYIDYFLNARQDQIAQHYNLRTYEPGMQASWVIRTTQIAYLRPVVAMEEVLVRTRLIYFDETSVVVEGMMLDKEEKRLKALIWFDFVYISLANGRPMKHPDELMGLLTTAAFHGEYEPSGFLRRVELVRRQSRKRAEAEINPALE